MNVVVLSVCLVVILLFKNIVGERAAGLIDSIAGSSGSGAGVAAGSGDGTGEPLASGPADPSRSAARTVSTARALLHRALPDPPTTP